MHENIDTNFHSIAEECCDVMALRLKNPIKINTQKGMECAENIVIK